MARFSSFFLFFNDTATTEIYTLCLHDALPISSRRSRAAAASRSTEVPQRCWFLSSALFTVRLFLLYNQRHMYGEAALQFVRKRLGSCKEDAVNPEGFSGANVFHAVIQQQSVRCTHAESGQRMLVDVARRLGAAKVAGEGGVIELRQPRTFDDVIAHRRRHIRKQPSAKSSGAHPLRPRGHYRVGMRPTGAINPL